MENEAHSAAAAPVPAAPSPAARPSLVRVAVVTTMYGEVRRLPEAEALALIEKGDARHATEVDLAFGG